MWVLKNKWIIIWCFKVVEHKYCSFNKQQTQLHNVSLKWRSGKMHLILIGSHSHLSAAHLSGNEWMDGFRIRSSSKCKFFVFLFFFFLWKTIFVHVALCFLEFSLICFPVSETQRQKALSPSSALTGPFHTLAAPQSLPGDRWQRHKDNTGGCRPPGGEMLSHTKISWCHSGEVKNRAKGEGGIMKRGRDNKEIGEEIQWISEWGEHMKENKSINITIIPEAFLWIMFLW